MVLDKGGQLEANFVLFMTSILQTNEKKEKYILEYHLPTNDIILAHSFVASPEK